MFAVFQAFQTSHCFESVLVMQCFHFMEINLLQFTLETETFQEISQI